MKKAFTMPKIVVEQFVPNEYVSACGDTEYGKYLFECDAPEGTLYYYSPFLGTMRLGRYTPCGETHLADKDSEFAAGFVDYNGNSQEDEGEHVVVWIERGFLGSIQNAHATTNLDQDSWETTKS